MAKKRNPFKIDLATDVDKKTGQVFVRTLVSRLDAEGNLVPDDKTSSSSGGSAVGGGDTTYSNVYGDFNLTLNDGTKTFDITSLPFTLESINVAAIRHIKSTGEVLSVPLTNILVSGDTVTVDDAVEPFSTGDHLIVYLEGVPKAYDIDYDTLKVIIQNSLNQDTVKTIDLTNASEDTYNYEIDFDGYNSASLFYYITAGASDTVDMTIWATNKSDADSTTDTYWVDVTTEINDGAISVSNDTEKGMDFIDTRFVCEKFKVKVVITGGTANTVELWTKKQLSS